MRSVWADKGQILAPLSLHLEDHTARVPGQVGRELHTVQKGGESCY